MFSTITIVQLQLKSQMKQGVARAPHPEREKRKLNVEKYECVEWWFCTSSTSSTKEMILFIRCVHTSTFALLGLFFTFYFLTARSF
jgi:nitrate reductase gamma subunit